MGLPFAIRFMEAKIRILVYSERKWERPMTSRTRSQFFLLLSVVLSFVAVVWSADNPKVNVESRAKPAAASPAGPKTDIRVDTNVVLIPVTVTDPINRFVTGLEKEHFKVFEDKIEQ